MSDPIIELRGVSLGYGRRVVLERADLAVRAGEFWCLLGPNAAGKTTVLKAVLGELAPVAGSLRIDPGTASRSHVGFVPQSASMNPTLPTTVREFVGLGLVGLRVGRAGRAERLKWALGRLGLGSRERESYARLSGGQRQRALVARALARRPSVLVLDEPTQELDKVAEHELLETIADLNATDRVTVIFVTHQLEIAARYASHVALFRGGSIVSGRRDELLTAGALAGTFGGDSEFFEPVLRASARPGATG